MRETKLRSHLSLSILMLIFSLSLHSCNSGLEEKLIGTWKGSDHFFVRTGGPDVVVTIDGGVERHLVSRLVLHEDRSYQEFMGEYDNGTGTWKVVNEDLILNGDSGNELIYKVLKATDNELITRREVVLDTPSGVLSGEITLSYTR